MEIKDDMSADMMRMLVEGSTNDVKIVLYDGEIRANRDILAFRCEYFAATFRWMKSNDQDGAGDIRIQDCSKKVMERVVEYLISGVMRLKDLGFFHLLELVHQIRKLMLKDGLRQKIEKYIRDVFICVATWKKKDRWRGSCQDLVLGINYAERHNLDEIKRNITDEIGANFYVFVTLDDIGGREAFASLTQLNIGSLKEIFLICKEIIDTERRYSVMRDLNNMLFVCFRVWYGKNKLVCGKEEKAEMLEMLDLNLFGLSTLIKKVKSSGMFPEEEVNKRIDHLAKHFDKITYKANKTSAMILEEMNVQI